MKVAVVKFREDRVHVDGVGMVGPIDFRRESRLACQIDWNRRALIITSTAKVPEGTTPPLATLVLFEMVSNLQVEQEPAKKAASEKSAA